MTLEEKTTQEIDQLKNDLLKEIQNHGGSAGNVALIKALGWDKNDYWRIRNKLVDAGLLQRGKGRGGSVRIIDRDIQGEEEAAKQEDDVSLGIVEEKELYAPLKKVLQDQWVQDNRFRESLVETTAQQGRKKTQGKWSRPDLTVVASSTYTYLPYKYLDIVTFEVKGAYAIDVTAVYEALAHRRAATKSYVIIHVPSDMINEMETVNVVDKVADEAKRHGIGLIVVSDPEDYDSWDVREEAMQVPMIPDAVNEFITQQISDGGRQEIIQWFK